MLHSKRNLTCHIIFWITLILVAYFAENVVLLDSGNFQRTFSTVEYVLLTFVILILVGYYFYIEYKKNDYKPNIWLIVILFILGIVGSIGLILTPNLQHFITVEMVNGTEAFVTREFIVSSQDKFHSFLFLFVALIGVYLQVAILPRLVSFKKYLLFLLYAVVVVSIISIFASYFLDENTYLHLYQHGLVGYKFPMSFLFNRNMYALTLMFGTFALYYIISLKPKWYNHLVLLFIVVNMFFTFSKAAIGITLITYIINFVYRMVLTFKKHKRRNLFFLIIIVITITFLFLLLPFPGLDNLTFLNKPRRFINDYFINLGPSTFSSRIKIWDKTNEIMTSNFFIFGRGLRIFNDTLAIYMFKITDPTPLTTAFSHNGFVEIFGQFGIIGLIIYLLGLVILVGVIFYVSTKNKQIGFPSILVLIAFLFYTMVETSTLFDPTIEGIVTTMLVALPSLSWLYHKKRPEVNNEIIENATNVKTKYRKENIFVFVRKTSFFTSLVMTASFIVIFNFFRKNNFGLSSTLLLGSYVLLSLFSLPLITHQIYKVRIKRHEELFWLLFIFNLFSHFGFIITYIFFSKNFILILGLCTVVLFLFTSLLFGRKYAQINKTYSVRTFIYNLLVICLNSIILLISIFFSNVTPFILGELIILMTILAFPFITRVSKFDRTLNDKMLFRFGKNIKYFSEISRA